MTRGDGRRRRGRSKRHANQAHNRCVICGFEWWAEPGPHTKCLRCDALYVKWLNWHEDWNAA